MRIFRLFYLLINIFILQLIQVAHAETEQVIRQGGLYLEEITEKDSQMHIMHDSNRLTTVEFNQKYYLLYGIPYNTKIGAHTVEVTANNKKRFIRMNLKSKKFDTQYIKIANKYISPSTNTLSRIEKERANISRAKEMWLNSNPDIKFIKPVDGITTGTYGTKRFYNNEEGNYHNGLDIAAPTGTHILSPSSGKVILTGDYYYNGKFIYLDHGKGLKSIFIHLDKILVETGQIITKGEVIGKVGNSGASAGPHLHWSVMLNKTYIDPEIFLNHRIIRYFSLED